MGKNKVLLVEDYEDSRLAMKYIIEEFGYEVIEAADGQEAIDQAQNECPSLILMDIGLPKIDGIQATYTIKSQICPNVPIVAVTAYENARDYALAAGCLDVIKKPVDFAQMGEVLRSYCHGNADAAS